MHTFYKARRFPLYFIPAIIMAYPCSSTVMSAIFLSVLLYLTTKWSQYMRIMLAFTEDKHGSFILFEDNLCHVKRNGIKYFICKKNYYIIADKIVKLENKLDFKIHELKEIIGEMSKPDEDSLIISEGKEIESEKVSSMKKRDLDNETMEKDDIPENKTQNQPKNIENKIINSARVALHSECKKKRICAINQLYEYLNIPNDFDYQPPSFHRLFLQHATAPLFVFQIFCSLLWCLDEYPYHALITAIMQVIFEAGIVFTRVKNLQEFGTLKLRALNILDLKKGLKNSVTLRPGDVIRLTDIGDQVPCDMIIIKGSAAVCEAMLTGESTIVKKEMIAEDDERILSDETHKNNILYGGTELVKIGLNQNSRTSDNKNQSYIECYILRTGFDTQQGQLIKTMMDGEEITLNNKEAFMFIICLLFFAIIASSYVIKSGIENGKDAYKILLEVIIIMTNVVPPELPMEMTLAVNTALQNLLQHNVFCLESFRIPVAGKVEVCCFDKTGTLTEVALSVVKVLLPQNQNIETESFLEVTPETIQETIHEDINLIVSCCHSLIALRGIRGDPLEESIFKFLHLRLSNEDEAKDDKYNYKVLKKYSFTSELRRMTVITERTKTNSEVFVCMKGAPEVVLEYLTEVPKNFYEFEKFSAKGYRVIALAKKKYKYKVNYNREDVEKNLEFAGFILYDCKIKHDTVEAIKILKESEHKLVMITGDNLLTAISVAKRVGMIDISSIDEENQVNKKDNQIQHYYDNIGVEGDEIDKILKSDSFKNYSVFARANPKQKEQIITKYKAYGKVTMMCGDGTNDVGALKTADVGVALVEGKKTKKNALKRGLSEEDHVKLGDASVAAPFTAKTGSIMGVVDIIKQGRSTLVTTIQMYKILGLNSLISAYTLSILDCMGIRYGDVQMTISGVLIAFAFMFLTRSKTLKEISKKKPVDNIFNKYIIFSVILQTIVHILAYSSLLKSGIVESNLEYETLGFGLKSSMIDEKYSSSVINIVKEIKPEEKNKFRPSLLNSSLFLLSISQQINTFIINYIGRPFRESLVENTKLNLSLIGVAAIVIGLVFEVHEGFSRMMEIVPLNKFKWPLFIIITIDFVLCYVIEKICFYFFML